jgi:hypothetical protein
MLKSEDDAWILFENLLENSLHHSSFGRRINAKSQTLYEVSNFYTKFGLSVLLYPKLKIIHCPQCVKNEIMVKG